ncbi:MAG: DegT/DnrJ/EryC1/StrS family aminotransferase [Thermoleophilia bacterium]|nr:DegT/DnrJ/EryC1/StrS family aminotransferase [Thermoleophilia bacterium]
MDTHNDIGMVDFVAQWDDVADDVTDAVRRVGASGWLVLGGEVQAFEADLAVVFGRRHAVGCASGLDAIELALRALGVGPGERVVTTPLTAFATTLAVVRAGAIPVFVDTDPSGQMCPDATRAAVARGPVAAVLPVHLYGHACDAPALRRIADQAGAPLIEDCAQAILNPRAGGTGAAAAVSFYPTKNLGAYGDGGAVLFDDDAPADAARRMRNYGQADRYEHVALGMNSRLDEVQAALLRTAMLPRLRAATARRRAIAEHYTSALRHPDVSVVAPAGESVWHLFPVLVRGDRAAFQDHLRRHGVASNVHYPILCPDQPALAGCDFEVSGDLVNARRLARGEVSLPLHPHLSDADVDRVVAACNSWAPR